MFLELISLCKCNFLSFRNYFLVQVQVGVLPELIFKQVVMQVPFSSIPGFGVLRWGCATAERIRWELLPWKI